MSQIETFNANHLICGLKTALTTLERQNNMHLLQQPQAEKIHNQSMYVTVPIKKPKHSSICSQQEPTCESHCKKKAEEGKVRPNKNCSIEMKDCVGAMKVPEMRGGYLYTRCDCLYRNGLQDSCPLTGCQGQPKCVVKPWPVCEPGLYYKSLNPELFGGTLQKAKRKRRRS